MVFSEWEEEEEGEEEGGEEAEGVEVGEEVDDVSVSLSVNPSLSVEYRSNCPFTSPSGSLHKHAHHIIGAAANGLTHRPLLVSSQTLSLLPCSRNPQETYPETH